MKGRLPLISLYGATYELIVREQRDKNCTFFDVDYDITSHPSSSTDISAAREGFVDIISCNTWCVLTWEEFDQSW